MTIEKLEGHKDIKFMNRSTKHEPENYGTFAERKNKKHQRGTPVGLFRLRRLLWRKNRVDGTMYQIDEPWAWKATQKPKPGVRLKNRKANRLARKNRKMLNVQRHS